MYRINQNQEIVRMLLKLKDIEEDYPVRLFLISKNIICDVDRSLCWRSHSVLICKHLLEFNSYAAPHSNIVIIS